MNTIRTISPASFLIIAIGAIFFVIHAASAQTTIDNSGIWPTPAQNPWEAFYLQELANYLVQILTEIMRLMP